MNIEEYISSGIIEMYVLGTASESEVRELELLSTTHPEIREAVRMCEIDIENLALQNPLPPPGTLKQKIWQSIKEDNAENNSPDLSVTKSGDAGKAPNRNWIKYLSAAAVLALIISIGYNINYSLKIRKQNTAFAQLKNDQQDLLNQKNILAQIISPSVKTVVLQGVPAHQNAKATVYWDTTLKTTYLVLNALPRTEPGKQYQLWALVKGKPIDAGLYNSNDPDPIQKLKDISNADMFAITLEPKGGSVSPTMSQMYVAGKL